MEEDADLFADFPELPFAHSDNVLTLDPNLSRVGLHQSYEMLKQNAFAATAASNDGEGFTSCDFKIDATQNFLFPYLFSPMPAPQSLAKICSKPDEA